MAGLYIHIPFCKSRCIYCGFYSTVSLASRQRYVEAVCREMELRSLKADGCQVQIDTIYLGGGTPSQLTPDQLRQLFLYINKVYAPNPQEVTIEVNPDDVTPAYAALLSELPINRISMGAQTFDNGRLGFLHRRHTAQQVVQAVRQLRDAGFDNISIDLMYGFPNESLSQWEHDIDAALSLHVEHLSAYCLMIEEGTVLHERMQQGCGEMPPCDEDTERQMYDVLIDRLTAAGYEHYELSNFAKPGHRSLHNSSYWQDVPYIGLGAAAHSYSMNQRTWNVSDIRQYMEAIEEGRIPFEAEWLDDDTRYNDRITVTLRTREGLDLTMLKDRYRRYCEHEAQRFIDSGLLRRCGNRLVLTRQGLFVSDYIMSSLIYA